MFSKALFKQSCKANGTMWAIITFAVCFMLACVMLISGSGNISETKNAIEDTIVKQEIESSFKKRAISYYGYAQDGLMNFDRFYAQNAQEALTYHGAFAAWQAAMPQPEKLSKEEYQAAMAAWQEKMPQPETLAAKLYALNFSTWNEQKPARESFSSDEEYALALKEWSQKSPATVQGAAAAAYTVSVSNLKDYALELAKSIDPACTEESNEAGEILGSMMYVLNPAGNFDSFYTDHGESVPETYDVTELTQHVAAGDAQEYISSAQRTAYRSQRAQSGSAVFLAGNLTTAENEEKIISELSDYGVTQEKYDSFGYTYSYVKETAVTAAITYGNRLDYEIGELEQQLNNGQITKEQYNEAVQAKQTELTQSIAGSLLSTLPSEVSDALEEIGSMDLYSLIVGSIFYKLAGLLLPIIYMIMASNNLIAGQVDSGSMAYVLSTSTKRRSVAFTQAVYLIGSLFAMFALTTATGCICLTQVSADIKLTCEKLVLLNLGAFLVLFALSGLCFFTSCWFDRSKRSMAIGGGLSIFALVAAMLGLFGSPVLPNVVRLDSLNYFNYATIITMFDVISIIDGTNVFIWKLAVLFVLGLTGYIAGSEKFVRKDLPL